MSPWASDEQLRSCAGDCGLRTAESFSSQSLTVDLMNLVGEEVNINVLIEDVQYKSKSVNPYPQLHSHLAH